MICLKCKTEAIKNHALFKEFYYCRTCKEEVFESILEEQPIILPISTSISLPINSSAYILTANIIANANYYHGQNLLAKSVKVSHNDFENISLAYGWSVSAPNGRYVIVANGPQGDIFVYKDASLKDGELKWM